MIARASSAAFIFRGTLVGKGLLNSIFHLLFLGSFNGNYFSMVD